MSDIEQSKSVSSGSDAIDLGGLDSFDFTPAWAKSTPEDGLKCFKTGRYGDEKREAKRDHSRTQGRGPRDSFKKRPGPRPEALRRDEGPRFAPPPPPLDIEVRVLPEQKALGAIIRKIQSTHRAFPLKEIAYQFLDHANALLLKIGPKKDSAQTMPKIWQCRHCGLPALSEAEIAAHAISAHLADYYDVEEVECEAPKGAFSCVVKCGLSGELIGPPNLHDFNSKIHELMRTRYPSMSEEEYRSHLVTIHDSEAVEAWRASATKKTVYRLKAAAPAAAPEGDAAPSEEPLRPALEREQAELEFRRTVLPGLVSSPKNPVVTAQIGMASPSRRLVTAFREALRKEERFPASLFFALRGAFHHRKLEFFRTNDDRGQEFVSAVKAVPLDAAHAVPVLTALVNYVNMHQGVTVGEIVPAVCGGDDSMHEEAVKSLSLLIEKGHLIAFDDDQLAIPAEHPVYRRRPRAKKNEKPAGESAAPSETAAPSEAAAAPSETAAPTEA